MFLAYGSYVHAANEADIAISRSPIPNDSGQRVGIRERWTITGELHAASQAALTTAINALLVAYGQDGRDLRLLLDDGTTLSSHFLDSSLSTTGTRVVSGPNFPGGRPAEYSTFRSYQIEVEADFSVNSTNPLFQLLAFVESLTLSGGGPRDLHVETVNTLPIKQRVQQATTYRAVQEGRAIGRTTWPAPPGPIFPGDLDGNPEISRRSPERRDNGNGIPFYENFETLWRYEFASSTPLVGFPTLWL